VLVQTLEQTHCIAVGTFTWRGKATPIAIRVHEDGLLLQRLYFADEVHNAVEIDRGAEPTIRDQERTLAERLISEFSAAECHPENYEDEYRKRLLKAIEPKWRVNRPAPSGRERTGTGGGPLSWPRLSAMQREAGPSRPGRPSIPTWARCSSRS
jgi:non-homologous end joining protein Ku